MIDGFWSGVFGGLFGPSAVRFLRKFRLAGIFLCFLTITPIAFFLFDVIQSGWAIAAQRFLSKKFFGLLLGGVALGAIAVLVVGISTAIMPAQRRGRSLKD
ncbi:hypothetical protein [Dyella sp.]|uniref:hypothetical protein n=1 Tax=Dyella sp. TaxID=1869338 RepID=UPI002FD93AC0